MPSALNVGNYISAVDDTNQIKKMESSAEQLLYGFVGEIGGILTNLKKSKRDSITEKDANLIGEELGDSFWYFFAFLKASGASPKNVVKACVPKNLPDDFDVNDISFRVIYSTVETDAFPNEPNLSDTLKSVLVSIGELSAAVSQNDIKSVENTLSEIFKSLVLICYLKGIYLDDVLRENIKKVSSRWPSGDVAFTALFDDEYPEHEQFDRNLTFQFREYELKGSKYCYMSLNGVNIGGRLTDNSHDEDGYRFHDVFHMAYLVYLGWSPVLRALLKLKRKSKPEIDENEDGARAIIIEEGIATWIFNHAKEASYFKDMEVGKLSYSLLKQIQSLVSGYEVEKCPPWQWEQAIINGFKVFNELKVHGKGFVNLDLVNRKLTFSELNPNRKAEK